MSARRSGRSLAIGAVVVTAAFGLISCASASASDQGGDITTITVGSMFPATEMLEFVNDNLAADAGISIEIVEFSEYTPVNQALDEGSLDANLYQHVPYMQNFNEEQGTNIVPVGKVYFPAIAIYSHSLGDISEIPEGSTFTLPADPANLGRSLELLSSAGLIETTDAPKSVDDITANPKNLEWSLLDAPQLPRALDDVPAGIVNFVYAGPAGLTSDDQLVVEEVEGSVYANHLAVNAGDENNPEIQTLLELLNSQETTDFINEQWNGLVIPVSGVTTFDDLK